MKAAALLALAATGCASTLSTLQTARPVEKGHVQITGGMGWYFPLGPISSVIGQGVRQADAARKAIEKGEPYALTEEDQQELLTAGIALAVMPPYATYEVALRTGVAKDLDLGLRYSLTALRLDGKYRLLHSGDGPPPPQPGSKPAVAPAAGKSLDLAVGLGVSRYFFSSILFDILGFVKLDDFSRWDLELPLYASAEFGEVVKLTFAPKYVYSRTSMDEKLVAASEQASNLSGFDVSLPAKVDTHFFGASAGIGLGYRWVHLLLELTAGFTYCKPELFGAERQLGGLTIQPAAALAISI
ncbi:MAG: hypothetical protein HYZ28_04450 [Myxococcales bacterium]|nr:hypothetical protein [Myxococcales bacterium]